MNAKSARRLIDEVCREAAAARGSLGRALRPAGFALVLGVGALTPACEGGDDGVDAIGAAYDAYGVPDDAAVDAFGSSVDAYGILVDAGVDAVPPAGDAYGIPSDAGE